MKSFLCMRSIKKTKKYISNRLLNLFVTLVLYTSCRDCVADKMTVTGWTRGIVRFPSRVFLYSKRPDQLWGSQSLLPNGYRTLPEDYTARA